MNYHFCDPIAVLKVLLFPQFKHFCPSNFWNFVLYTYVSPPLGCEQCCLTHYYPHSLTENLAYQRPMGTQPLPLAEFFFYLVCPQSP